MGKDVESLLYRFVFTITASENFDENLMIGLVPVLEDTITTALVPKKYSFQLERGGVAGKLHFQGRFSLHNKKSIKSVIKLLMPFVKINKGWQLHVDRERSDETTSTLYTRKSSTAIADTFTTSEKLHASDYTGADLYLDTNPHGTFRWQYQLEEHMTAPFGKYLDPATSRRDYRLIDILSDPRGNHGKSVFIKRFIYKHGRDVFFIPVVDNPTQIVSAFISFVESNNNVGPKFVLIDIPRAIDYGTHSGSNDTIIKIHNIAEILRAGLVTSSMYGKYKQVMINPPRVLIMTNYSYQTSRDFLWCPENRFQVHRLITAGNEIIIPTLIR